MPKKEESKEWQAIEEAIEEIRRQYGEGAIMRLGELKVSEIEVIPTGSPSLDFALGVGGVPRGRVIEIFGPEASGKTTLALHIIAEAQKSGLAAAFIDAEHALDPAYARNIGVNLKNLLISQPDSGEQALEIVETLVRSNKVGVIVIDSVAALVPRAELEGEMGEAQIGLQARLMSQALRKLTAAVARSNTAVVFVNQLRMKIGVMFGNPETTPGGVALKFYSSVRLDIRRTESLQQGGVQLGNRVRVKVVKNKVAPPFRQAEFTILFNKGIDRWDDLADLAAKLGVVSRSGSWYEYGGEKFSGKESLKKYLEENPKSVAEIEQRLLALRKTA